MLLNNFYNQKLFNKLSHITCSCGFKIEDIIKSGKDNPDSSIGIYAGCEDCYKNFSELFNPIIEKYHNIKLINKQPENISYINNHKYQFTDNNFILSTRIRVGRNIKGIPFPPAISKEKRKKVENIAKKTFSNFKNKLSGNYYSLKSLDEITKNELIEKHFLFKQGDRFLEAAGCNRDWPDSRGIFLSNDNKFIVWVNEEDSFRIISMDKGYNLANIFNKLIFALIEMKKHISFAKDDYLGYLSSCPTNLGTSLRASVHIKLPKLSLQTDFKNICSDLKLSVRGKHGEHTEAEDGIFDISNKPRLGLSEIDCVDILYNGIQKLIELEKAL